MRSPRFVRELLDVGEMLVARHHRKIVLKRNRGDPNIILGNRTTLRSKVVLYAAVESGRFTVATEDRRRCREVVDARKIVFDPR